MATYYDILDLVNATLFSEQKRKITNIDPTLLRSYPAANRLVQKKQVKEQGGLDVKFRVNVSGNTSARTFGPYHTVARTQGDHLKTASMQLRNIRADYSFDALEPEFNGGEEMLVDVIKNRQQNCKIGLTQLIESFAWSNAAYGDDQTPQGILLWLPYVSSTGQASQFLGTYPTSYTDVAGIDPVVYTGWKSYGDVYVAPTDADLFLKMRQAFSETHFMAPIMPMLISDFSTGWDWQIYMNLRTMLQFEDAVKLQNDNIGNDLDKYNGAVMFRRVPLTEVPTLQANTRDPVFGKNWGVFENRVKKGWWMRDDDVAQDPSQPLTVSKDMYCVYNEICYDRRTAGFNISKAA